MLSKQILSFLDKRHHKSRLTIRESMSQNPVSNPISLIKKQSNQNEKS